MAQFLENPTVLIDVDKTTLEAKRIQRVGKIDSGVNRIKDVTLVSAEKTSLDTILAAITNKHLTGGAPVTLVFTATTAARRGQDYSAGPKWLRDPSQFTSDNSARFVIPEFNEFLIDINSGGSISNQAWQVIDDGGANVLSHKSRTAAESHWLICPVDLAAFGKWKMTFKIKNPTADPSSAGNLFRLGFGRRGWKLPIDQAVAGFSDPLIIPYAGEVLNTYLEWGNLGGANHEFKIYRYNPDRSRTEIAQSASEYPIAYYKISVENDGTKIIYTLDVDGDQSTEIISVNIADMIEFENLFMVLGMLTDNGGLSQVNIEEIVVEINGHGTGAILNDDYRIVAQLREDTGAIQRLTYEGMDILDANSKLVKSPGARLFTAGQNATDLQTSLTAIWNKIKTDEGIT